MTITWLGNREFSMGGGGVIELDSYS